MHLRSITNHNFKSYFGTITIGPFHESFTAIVGPNGSGKSNVIDSILFVLGFKARSLRLPKLSSLIHSSNNKTCTSAYVILHFILDDGSNMDVMRSIDSNDKSKFEINGVVSSWTAVTTRFKDLGIDLDHKRFLILQGEVESISQMKPKGDNDDGLLEYLEDIIGSFVHKSKIAEINLLVQVHLLNIEFKQREK